MGKGRRSTVVVVAERAGVSIATVSRVLNDLPASEATIAKVRRAAAELAYVPDAVARSLKVGRTEQIVLAVADVGNPVYVSMIHAVNDAVAAAGYRLVISSTGIDPQDQIDLLTSLNRGYADGLILVPLRVTEPLLAELAATRLPIVVIGSLPASVDLDNVRADSAKGVGLAMEHLHAQGCRRIAFVNGPVDTVPGTARLSGYVQATAQLGLHTSAELQVEADDFTFAAGLAAASALLNQSTPDAIMCANDLLAVAAMKVAASRGLKVPDDVALVGMDDTDIAEVVSPSLTSVDLGSTRRARQAADLLLAHLADPEHRARRVVIPPRLTIRQSSVRDITPSLVPRPAKKRGRP